VLVELATVAHAAPDRLATEVLKDTPAAYWQLNEQHLDDPARGFRL